MKRTQKRRPLVAGNWKMHGTQRSTEQLLCALKLAVDRASHVKMLVFPPAVFLGKTQSMLSNTTIAWGAQNFYPEASGAFTGEISTDMLGEFGCRYALVGHSERRLLFSESPALIARKCMAAFSQQITPIVCIGEGASDRENHRTTQVLEQQLADILPPCHENGYLSSLVIAYEPVWAIGTGAAAEPQHVQAVHAEIRGKIARFDPQAADRVLILYGGSLKRHNARAMFAMPDVDGGLVGGAALDASEFLDIAQLCSS